MALTNGTYNNIEKQFEFLECLGRGADGEVWKASHKKTDKVLAIKKIVWNHAEESAELMREIKIMKDCDSPAIVHYFGSCLVESVMWIIMEYCSLGSVSDVMRMTNKTLEEAQIATVCQYALRGLAYLQKIKSIHRDIKPHNILVNHKGEAKLADFGVASDGANEPRTTVIGTPFYLAPEIIQESGYDFKVDIWALCISAIEMAEKEPPFHDVHPMRVLFLIPTNPAPTLTHPMHWSEEFNDFLAKGLTKDPASRPFASELLEHSFLKKANKRAMTTLIRQAEEVIEKKGGFENATKEEPKEADNPASMALFDLNDLESITESEYDSDDVYTSDESEEELNDNRNTTIVRETRKKSTPPGFLSPGKEQSKIILLNKKEKAPISNSSARRVQTVVSPEVPKVEVPKVTEPPVAQSKTSINWDELSKELEGHDLSATVKQLEDHKKKTRSPYTKNLFNKFASSDSLLRPKPLTRPSRSFSSLLNNKNGNRPLSVPPGKINDFKIAVSKTRRQKRTEFDDLLSELDALDANFQTSNPRKKKLVKRGSAETHSFKRDIYAQKNTAYASHVKKGIWTGIAKGENPFRNNPQFVVSISKPTQILVTLQQQDKNNLSIGFYVLKLREIDYSLPILPKYTHKEVPYSVRQEVNTEVYLDDPNFKYVIVPCVESLDRGSTSRFALILLAPRSGMINISQLPKYQNAVVHGEWNKETAGGCTKFPTWRRNPQYIMRLYKDVSDIYIFLTQHVPTPHYLGLYCFDADEDMPLQPLLTFERERLVNKDSRFHMINEVTTGKLSLKKGDYILLPCTFNDGKTAPFTITALSTTSVSFFPLKRQIEHTLNGQWKKESAGGCMNHSTWVRNPKILVTVKQRSVATLILDKMRSPGSSGPYIGCYLFKTASEDDASRLRPSDIHAKTKHFVETREVSRTVQLEPGQYVMMPCTYKPGYIGPYAVRIFCLHSVQLNLIEESSDQIISHKGEWALGTSGGCINFPTWRLNSQYCLGSPIDTKVDIILEQDKRDNMPHAGLCIVRVNNFDGNKILNFDISDVIVTTKFFPSKRVLQTVAVKRGETLVVIPSTFGVDEVNTYTITASGPKNLVFRHIENRWAHKAFHGNWSKKNETVGGCMNNKTWLQNPKYALILKAEAKVLFVLSQKDHDSLQTMGFYVFKRPTDAVFSRRHLAGKSEYSCSREVRCQLQLLPNFYVIIPTRFHAGSQGAFEMHIFSDAPFQGVEVPTAPSQVGS
eukprot:CAMPEP_0168535114 /NCGR_PEP_ID=MMETSP0405-20121227/18435_1 /TAXON_ID=498012 /ORGANISM="Trichosphaerium sp, Strain Am-I-7 wt" /LENGTH=1236 /DNA_ID=CAMNT_0008562215 /DNA_START=48 /DNA_END=3758 /DNA_ORIENTATION=+